MILRVLVSLICLALPISANAANAHIDDSHKVFKRHTFGAFIGKLRTDQETDSSIGLEYEYRLTQQFGMGVTYEDAPHAHHDDGVRAAIASIYMHPFGNWRLGLGAGRERVGGAHAHDSPLTRLSIGYEFHFGHWGLGPSFNLDRVDGHNSRVYGLTLVYAY